MTKKPIEMGKQYVEQKSGRPVRVLAVDVNRSSKEFTVIVLRTTEHGIEYPDSYTKHGQHSISGSSDFDLVEAPQKFEIEMWVNVYPEGRGAQYGRVGGRLYLTHETALGEAAPGVVACVPVVVRGTEGEGLKIK